MKKADEILKAAQDRQVRRAALVRAGVIRVAPERDVPPPDDQERVEAAPKQDESR
jgi:hypothetical protein